MQKSLNKEKIQVLSFAVGNEMLLLDMPNILPLCPFDDMIVDFLNHLSKKIMMNKEARKYPDVITFAFWIRKSNLMEMKKQYHEDTNDYYSVGRGMLFHIAPSNVPINYAYSLVTGLLSGNANVVKIPSKKFEQVELVNRMINECLEEMINVQPYIVLVQYGHEKEVNDALSEYADGRVIWGGDHTIEEIRKSPLQARAVEVTFADRYSLAVIDADQYMLLNDKKKIANDFYNDTYLTDQNACTSPRAVIWFGDRIAEAKDRFWSELHEVVASKYQLQPVQAVNKLTSAYMIAAQQEGIHKVSAEDNLIIRMDVKQLDDTTMDWKDNSGYFFEYICSDVKELKDICNNTHCQTISYIGDRDMFLPLLSMGIKGVDRIVPVGQTMDFEFVWDGYDLIKQFARIIRMK